MQGGCESSDLLIQTQSPATHGTEAAFCAAEALVRLGSGRSGEAYKCRALVAHTMHTDNTTITDCLQR